MSSLENAKQERNNICKVKLTKGTSQHHFAKYNQWEHTSGETLPEEMQVYRIRVVTAFLKASVPSTKWKIFMIY